MYVEMYHTRMQICKKDELMKETQLNSTCMYYSSSIFCKRYRVKSKKRKEFYLLLLKLTLDLDLLNGITLVLYIYF